MDAQRLLKIKSPLGDGALHLVRLEATERLGRPHSVTLEVLSRNPDLQAKDLLTKDVTATIRRTIDGNVVERHFHGHVAAFARVGPGPAQRMAYRLVVVPTLWKLGLKSNCRIFQDKTAKEVITTILQDHDVSDVEWGILPALPTMDYCTQFNETDLAFVSRLMEEHGLTYYFKHASSAHTLQISGTAAGFPAFVGGDVIAVHETPLFNELGGWQRVNRQRSAKVRYEDMDSERSQPSVVQKKASDTRVYSDEPPMADTAEVFWWPGGMGTRPGHDPANVTMGRLETESEEYSAESQDPRLAPGARLMVGVRAEDGSTRRQQYAVTSAVHTAHDLSGLVAGAGGSETHATSITLVSTSRAFMPTAEHPRPQMAGLFSAKVTGPSGEVIHVDQFGRIKVKFRWDRLGKDDDTSSCWVRVMQAAAGSWGGTWFLPRVGDEVLVAFLDGDPDRPVVVGSVYGKDAKPPFGPAANRAQSGYKTRSYKSDSGDDANILRFEDKKGSEEVLLHAQKDLTVEVENDETRTVGNDQTQTIENQRTTTIKKSHDTLTLKQGNRSTTLDQGNETHTLKIGDLKVTCDLGSITIEAMQKITLKVGQSTVVLEQTGVTVKGMTITEEAQLQHSKKALMVQEEGSAMVVVKGGVVMLN